MEMVECWEGSCLTDSSQAGDYENAEKHSMQLWRQVKDSLYIVLIFFEGVTIFTILSSQKA